MADGVPIRLDEHTMIIPVFDPRLCNYNVHLWIDDLPWGIHGLTEWFTHPNDVLDTVDDFLTRSGVRALTESETFALASGLITSREYPHQVRES